MPTSNKSFTFIGENVSLWRGVSPIKEKGSIDFFPSGPFSLSTSMNTGDPAEAGQAGLAALKKVGGLQGKVQAYSWLDAKLMYDFSFSLGDADIEYDVDMTTEAVATAGTLKVRYTTDDVEQTRITVNPPMFDAKVKFDLKAVAGVDAEVRWDHAHRVGLNNPVFAGSYRLGEELKERSGRDGYEGDVAPQYDGFGKVDVDWGGDWLEAEIILFDARELIAQLAEEELGEDDYEALTTFLSEGRHIDDIYRFDVGGKNYGSIDLYWPGLPQGARVTAPTDDNGEADRAPASYRFDSEKFLRTTFEIDDLIETAFPGFGHLFGGSYSLGSVDLPDIPAEIEEIIKFITPFLGGGVLKDVTRRVLSDAIDGGEVNLGVEWDISDLDLNLDLSYFQNVTFQPTDDYAQVEVTYNGSVLGDGAIYEWDNDSDWAYVPLPDVDEGEVQVNLTHYLKGDLITEMGMRVTPNLEAKVAKLKVLNTEVLDSGTIFSQDLNGLDIPLGGETVPVTLTGATETITVPFSNVRGTNGPDGTAEYPYELTGERRKFLALGGDDYVIANPYLGSFIDGGSGDDVLIGGDGNDVLSGGVGNDAIRGGYGNDLLIAGAGEDELFGGAGRDILLGWGRESQDQLNGGDDNDLLVNGYISLGEEGDDIILHGGHSFAGGGDDEVIELFEDSFVFGERGNDRIFTRSVADPSGGDGDDLIIALPPDFDDVIVEVFGGPGNDTIYGTRVETAYDAFTMRDVLTDPEIAEISSIRSNTAEKVLDGGDGNDVLIGGIFDRLKGGPGADDFVNFAFKWNTTIDDFNSAEGDRILLDSFIKEEALLVEDGFVRLQFRRTKNWFETKVFSDADLSLDDFTIYHISTWDHENGNLRFDAVSTQALGIDAPTVEGPHAASVTLLELPSKDIRLLLYDGSTWDRFETISLADFAQVQVERVSTKLGNIGELELRFNATPDASMPWMEPYSENRSFFLTIGDGDDTLVATEWDKTLSGGAGNDVLFGREGLDRLDGGPGDDVFRGDARLILGGTGTDTVHRPERLQDLSVFANGDRYDVYHKDGRLLTTLDSVERIVTASTPAGVAVADIVAETERHAELAGLVHVATTTLPAILAGPEERSIEVALSPDGEYTAHLIETDNGDSVSYSFQVLDNATGDLVQTAGLSLPENYEADSGYDLFFHRVFGLFTILRDTSLAPVDSGTFLAWLEGVGEVDSAIYYNKFSWYPTEVGDIGTSGWRGATDIINAGQGFQVWLAQLPSDDGTFGNVVDQKQSVEDLVARFATWTFVNLDSDGELGGIVHENLPGAPAKAVINNPEFRELAGERLVRFDDGDLQVAMFSVLAGAEVDGSTVGDAVVIADARNQTLYLVETLGAQYVYAGYGQFDIDVNGQVGATWDVWDEHTLRVFSLPDQSVTTVLTAADFVDPADIASTFSDDERNRIDMAADGRFLTYAIPDLAANESDRNGVYDVYVYDVATGRQVLVSTNEAGELGTLQSYDPYFVDEGRRIEFTSQSEIYASEGLGQTRVVQVTNPFWIEAELGYAAATATLDEGVFADGSNLSSLALTDLLDVQVHRGTIMREAPSGSLSAGAAGPLVDFEALASDPTLAQDVLALELFVQLDNAAGRVPINVQLINTDEPISDITVKPVTVSENVAGAVVAELTWVEPDLYPAFREVAITVDDPRLRVGEDNVLYLKEGVAFDFEAATSHEVTVHLKDSTNSTFDRTFTIEVSDVVEQLLVGDDGDNHLDGTPGDDIIKGEAGDDILTGGSGNDNLDGGVGHDTAIFSGTRAEYTITHNGDDSFTVIDSVGGRDGSDSLRGVEALQFTDKLIFTVSFLQPDLTASNVTISDTTPDPGQVVNVSYTINNIEPGAAGAFDAGVYLSTDATITTDDSLLGDQSFASLAGSGSVDGNVSASLPSWVVPGTTYYVGVLADYLDTVTDELSESNNVSYVTVTIPTAPEIAVSWGGTNIADGDSTPSSSEGTDFGSVTQGGSAVQRTFTVLNSGTATLTLGALSMPTGFSLVEPLSTAIAPGSFDTFTVRLDTASTGTRSGQISFATNDSDENPFNFSVTGVVNAPEQPDLTASSVTISDTTPDPGQVVNVSYTVNNIESGAVGTFNAGVYLSTDTTITTADTFLSFESFASLAGNSSVNGDLSVTIPSEAVLGTTYYVGVIADNLNFITDELSESNNASFVAVTTPEPDIVGSPGNDTFFANSGKSFTGNGGHDTAIFSGTRAEYIITHNGDDSFTITDGVGGRDGIDSLNAIQVLDFSDKSIFIEDADGADIARLYSAALGRPPDTAGLFGWQDIYADNIPASAKAQGVYVALAQTNNGYGTSIAGGFVQSVEFQQLYGTLDDAGFVTQLYFNVLERAPEEAGLIGWLDLMHNAGFTRDMVLVGFAQSPENIAKTASDWLIEI